RPSCSTCASGGAKRPAPGSRRTFSTSASARRWTFGAPSCRRLDSEIQQSAGVRLLSSVRMLAAHRRSVMLHDCGETARKAFRGGRFRSEAGFHNHWRIEHGDCQQGCEETRRESTGEEAGRQSGCQGPREEGGGQGAGEETRGEGAGQEGRGQGP